jgi:hypothetical protein
MLFFFVCLCVYAALVDLSHMLVWIPEDESVWPPRIDVNSSSDLDCARISVFPDEFTFNGEKHMVPFTLGHIKKMGHKAVRAAGEQLLDLSKPMTEVPPPALPAPPPPPVEEPIPAEWVKIKEQLSYMQEHKLPVRLHYRFIAGTGGGNVPMDDGAISATYNRWKEEECNATITEVKINSHTSMSLECRLCQPITINHSTGVANRWLENSFKAQYRYTRISERPYFGQGERQHRTVTYAAGDTLRMYWQKDVCGGCSQFGCGANCNHIGGGKSDVFMHIVSAWSNWLPNPIQWILQTRGLGIKNGASLQRVVDEHKAATVVEQQLQRDVKPENLVNLPDPLEQQRDIKIENPVKNERSE